MGKEKSLRTEGVVLKRSDIGEADRLLTLYTREVGKLRVIAKGVRKPQSRKTGHVELFMRTDFLIATGRDLGVVTQADLIDPFLPLRENLILTTYSAYVVELLDKFTGDEDRNSSLYDLLLRTLSLLSTTDNLLLCARYYELRLLSLAGFQPQLFYCVGSGEPIEQEDQYFSAELGGLLRPKHKPADRAAKPISGSAVKVLRFLQTRDWDTVKGLQLKRTLHLELEQILHVYLTHILERQLKSVDFLRRLRTEAALFAEPDGENSLSETTDLP
jgi:DNA repair protein RecO (recombination protein O)